MFYSQIINRPPIFALLDFMYFFTQENILAGMATGLVNFVAMGFQMKPNLLLVTQSGNCLCTSAIIN